MRAPGWARLLRRGEKVDFWAITVAVVKRWFVVLPILLLAGAGAFLLGDSVAPEYDVRATWIVVPGSAVETEDTTVPNPYVNIAGAAEAVQNVLSSPQTAEQVKSLGLPTAYEVSIQTRSTIVTALIRADTADRGKETADVLLEVAREELVTRQTSAGVRPENQFSMAILAAPAVVAVIDSDRTRIQVVVIGGGVLAAVVAAIVVDSLILRIRRRRARRAAPEAVAGRADPIPGGEGAELDSGQRPARSPDQDSER